MKREERNSDTMYTIKNVVFRAYNFKWQNTAEELLQFIIRVEKNRLLMVVGDYN